MAEMMNVYQKLQKVQNEMKAPKNLYNEYGKYKYRNCESILEEFKKFGEKYGLLLKIEDDVKEVSGRFYFVAKATLINLDNTSEIITNTSMARESQEKKGMDESQISGTASSYARKYCLNGLFLLDDTKDADSGTDVPVRDISKPKANPKNKENIEKIKKELQRTGVKEHQILEKFSVKSFDSMTDIQFKEAIAKLEAMKDKASAKAGRSE